MTIDLDIRPFEECYLEDAVRTLEPVAHTLVRHVD